MSQQLTITVRFKTDHTPGTDEQLAQILHNYLRAKGVHLDLRDNSIEV